MTSSVATSRSSASSSTGCSAGSDEPALLRSDDRAVRESLDASWSIAPGGAEGLLALISVSVGDKGDFSAARAHADRLVALEVLALRLQRRRDHQLGPVE